MLRNTIGGNANGAGQLHVRFSPRHRIARINENELLPAFMRLPISATLNLMLSDIQSPTLSRCAMSKPRCTFLQRSLSILGPSARSIVRRQMSSVIRRRIGAATEDDQTIHDQRLVTSD